MFDRNNRNFTNCRVGFPNLATLGDVIGRWLPFASHRSTAGAALQHLGTLPLSTQSSLALVRVYNETLVLGITAHSVTLLTKTADDRSISALPSANVVTEQQNRGAFPTVSHKGEE